VGKSNKRRGAVPINVVTMHERPHLDEICALWMLQRFGEKLFPGVGEAKLVFTTNGARCQKTPEQLESEGILLLGCGGGRFDDHREMPEIGQVRQRCTADLVAEYLGVDQVPELTPLLDFVRRTDLGKAQPFDLSSLVKMYHAEPSLSGGDVVDLVMIALNANYISQQAFHDGARRDLESAKRREVQDPRTGKTWLIIYGQSNDERFAKSARFYIKNTALVVQQTTKGNIQIFGSDKLKFKLFGLAGALRKLEEEIRLGEVQEIDPKKRMVAGKMHELDVWYMHESGTLLLNGSLTTPDVDPTKIDLEAIADTAVKSLQIFFGPDKTNPKKPRS